MEGLDAQLSYRAGLNGGGVNASQQKQCLSTCDSNVSSDIWKLSL